mmetsp:Transcript_12690/g.58622  ORF Transcript_12690/g.58622 Transcript_12690/m.58622 type:complete len:265 (+) Transcript_12690:134-928(+)
MPAPATQSYLPQQRSPGRQGMGGSPSRRIPRPSRLDPGAERADDILEIPLDAKHAQARARTRLCIVVCPAKPLGADNFSAPPVTAHSRSRHIHARRRAYTARPAYQRVLHRLVGVRDDQDAKTKCGVSNIAEDVGKPDFALAEPGGERPLRLAGVRRGRGALVDPLPPSPRVPFITTHDRPQERTRIPGGGHIVPLIVVTVWGPQRHVDGAIKLRRVKPDRVGRLKRGDQRRLQSPGPRAQPHGHDPIIGPSHRFHRLGFHLAG